MGILPPKCKMLLRDWIDSQRNLVFTGILLGEIDKFRPLNNYCQSDHLVADVVCSRIQRAQRSFLCQIRHV